MNIYGNIFFGTIGDDIIINNKDFSFYNEVVGIYGNFYAVLYCGCVNRKRWKKFKLKLKDSLEFRLLYNVDDACRYVYNNVNELYNKLGYVLNDDEVVKLFLKMFCESLKIKYRYINDIGYEYFYKYLNSKRLMYKVFNLFGIRYYYNKSAKFKVEISVKNIRNYNIFFNGLKIKDNNELLYIFNDTVYIRGGERSVNNVILVEGYQDEVSYVSDGSIYQFFIIDKYIDVEYTKVYVDGEEYKYVSSFDLCKSNEKVYMLIEINGGVIVLFGDDRVVYPSKDQKVLIRYHVTSGFIKKLPTSFSFVDTVYDENGVIVDDIEIKYNSYDFVLFLGKDRDSIDVMRNYLYSYINYKPVLWSESDYRKMLYNDDIILDVLVQRVDNNEINIIVAKNDNNKYYVSDNDIGYIRRLLNDEFSLFVVKYNILRSYIVNIDINIYLSLNNKYIDNKNNILYDMKNMLTDFYSIKKEKNNVFNDILFIDLVDVINEYLVYFDNYSVKMYINNIIYKKVGNDYVMVGGINIDDSNYIEYECYLLNNRFSVLDDIKVYIYNYNGKNIYIGDMKYDVSSNILRLELDRNRFSGYEDKINLVYNNNLKFIVSFVIYKEIKDLVIKLDDDVKFGDILKGCEGIMLYCVSEDSINVKRDNVQSILKVNNINVYSV